MEGLWEIKLGLLKNKQFEKENNEYSKIDNRVDKNYYDYECGYKRPDDSKYHGIVYASFALFLLIICFRVYSTIICSNLIRTDYFPIYISPHIYLFIHSFMQNPLDMCLCVQFIICF